MAKPSRHETAIRVERQEIAERADSIQAKIKELEVELEVCDGELHTLDRVLAKAEEESKNGSAVSDPPDNGSDSGTSTPPVD